MNRILTLVCLVFLCIAYSCNSGSEKSAPQDVHIQLSERAFYDFKLRDNLDQTGELLLSTIASEIRYILENKRVFVLKAELNTRPRFFYFFG